MKQSVNQTDRFACLHRGLRHAGRSWMTFAVLVLCGAGFSHGQSTQTWDEPNGGAFNNAGNWDATVPGTDDTAIFGLDASYTVTFDSNVTHARTEVQDGEVTFDLGSSVYTLRDVDQDSLVIGNQTGKSPVLTLDGGHVRIAEGATERATEIMVGVGAGREGTLILTNNAVLTMHNTASHNHPLVVGHSGGKGVMTVSSGAVTNFGRYVFVGNDGGTGVLTLSGADTVLSYEEIFLSRLGGQGTLIVKDGATVKRRVNKPDQQFAFGAGSPTMVATAIVQNAGSTFDTGKITTHSPGKGYFFIREGGTVNSTVCDMGGNGSNRETETEVTGSDSLWTATEVYLGGQGPLIGNRSGKSLLTLADGGHLEASTRVVLLPRGTLRGDGAVAVTGEDGVINRGGLVAPGRSDDDQPRTLTIEGNYTQEVAVDGAETFPGALRIRIGESGGDRLAVDGDLTLDGTLDLIALNDPELAYRDTFQILSWTGDLSGVFSQTNTFEPAEGLWWDFDRLYVDGTIRVTGPPPGTLILLR